MYVCSAARLVDCAYTPNTHVYTCNMQLPVSRIPVVIQYMPGTYYYVRQALQVPTRKHIHSFLKATATAAVFRLFFISFSHISISRIHFITYYHMRQTYVQAKVYSNIISVPNNIEVHTQLHFIPSTNIEDTYT